MALSINYPDKVDYTPLQTMVDRIYVKKQPSLGKSMLKTTGDSLGKLGSAFELYNANQEKEKNEEEAQDKYEYCSNKIASDNKNNKESIKNLDIYGLDGDKDGIVCEALPHAIATN